MTSPDRLDAPRPDARPLRAVRSLAAALVCVAASAVGHRLAGGPMPLDAVLAVLTGSAAIAWPLSARRVTPGQLLGLLVLCQVGVHLMGTAAEMSMGPAMIAAHLAATAVSVAVLARGERFVWALGRRVADRVLPALRRPLPVPRLRQVGAVLTTDAPRDVWRAGPRAPRGPPVGLVRPSLSL